MVNGKLFLFPALHHLNQQLKTFLSWLFILRIWVKVPDTHLSSNQLWPYEIGTTHVWFPQLLHILSHWIEWGLSSERPGLPPLGCLCSCKCCNILKGLFQWVSLNNLSFCPPIYSCTWQSHALALVLLLKYVKSFFPLSMLLRAGIWSYELCTIRDRMWVMQIVGPIKSWDTCS